MRVEERDSGKKNSGEGEKEGERRRGAEEVDNRKEKKKMGEK